MLDAAGHHDELARPHVPVATPELQAQPSLHDEEELVFPLVVVPDELAAELDELHVHVVDLAHDLGRPVIGEPAERLGQVHDLHRGASRCRRIHPRRPAGVPARSILTWVMHEVNCRNGGA